ncbi:subtilisin-like protease [Phtheirospermum japonicum]|uniref:Subtilisin-like protease n=1 Tax=Phtheirospermum japonicum TaxID=374723 RepID=A0A830D644_9LAMI|nr:subtilisin-like protease [Phtheirospermum japonicum]
MAYKARLAAYKVCWESKCHVSDILAGMESAIGDGVDILSLSIIGIPASSYDDDFIAVGAFAAMERGIFVSCSAGNDGPDEASLYNVAPWIMTVGAGTLDRHFPAYVTLGNGEKYSGASSLCSGLGMKSNHVELVYGLGSSNSSASKLCLAGSLDPTVANWKVGDKIRRYVMSSTTHSTALLTFVGAEVNVKPSPVVAAFSSRGPNTMTPQILKPDIIAPGVNILAAWCHFIDHPFTLIYSIMLFVGTSMSCPHVSGLAALLRAAHPKWSPSIIKSALMTTAYTLDNTNSPLHDAANNTISTPWAHGSGHVNILKAFSPGLVYDATTKDYTVFLCSLNYTMDTIRFITNQSNINCARKLLDPGQLNYPSFSVVFTKSRFVWYTRVLTNVDAPWSIYRVKINAPPNVTVIVKPTVLVFKYVGDKQWYTITFVSHKGVDRLPKFGSISWENAKNQVKSPISFTWTTQF